MAEEYAKEEDLVLLCGHYEGIDERVLDMIVTDYVSIGDFVLTGGELPAMMIVDATSRLVPGVLGSDESAVYESFYDGLLEYPQYTRPEEFMGKKVPEVLLSGHHKNIEEWRYEQSMQRTQERRPDLYEIYVEAHREELENADEKKKKKNESGSVGSNVQKCRQMNNYCLSCREIWYIIFIISKENGRENHEKEYILQLLHWHLLVCLQAVERNPRMQPFR